MTLNKWGYHNNRNTKKMLGAKIVDWVVTVAGACRRPGNKIIGWEWLYAAFIY